MGKADKGKTSEKKVQKIVEDKTFGLKNKSKSAKVQKYVEQVTNTAKQSGGKNSQALQEQRAAARKAEKEARVAAELEMFKLLGDAYKPKEKSKKSKKKEEEQQKQKEEEEARLKQEQFDRDFSIPIILLKDVFQVDAKSEIPRICAVLEHKDNLISKNSAGKDCLYIKISDGSTLNPFTFVLTEETPTSFEKKVGVVLDIRNSVAMVRGEKILLESVPATTQLLECSPELSEHILKLKEEQEEIRAQGGIPIEQLIEEQRAKLDTSKLTPVTKESFFRWKEEKRKRREAEAEETRAREEKRTGKSIKNMNILSGRQLFLVDKELFKDDEDAFTDDEIDEVEELGNEAGEKLNLEVGNQDLFVENVDDEDLELDESSSEEEQAN